MASGHVNRTQRPNTWLHRPSLRREDSPCQLGAVHTWPIATVGAVQHSKWLMSVLGHVWTAPSWQGLSSRVQHWSVQPCVRPVDAVHMTAGHNALRGSGPGQKRAFDNALALVGCPDRRIDRLCITCCSPSQPFTSHRMPDAISFMPRAQRVLCSVRP